MTRYFLSFLCLFACLTVMPGCTTDTEPTLNVDGELTQEEIDYEASYEEEMKKNAQDTYGKKAN